MGLKTRIRSELWNMTIIRDDRRDEGETGDYEDGYSDGLQWALGEVKKEWAFLEAMESDAGTHGEEEFWKGVKYAVQIMKRRLGK
jgi:hypothetical protein